jgi:glucose-6-phosphate dehydrogenase assembly protein OpcA
MPSQSPLGALAQRRVTDSASGDGGPGSLALAGLAEAYKPGDTDFSWTRLTPWRTLLAATFDVPHPPVTRGEVQAERDNPSGDILAAWLSVRLGVPVRRAVSGGPGITDVRFETENGQIEISRHDGRTATLSKTGEPDRRVALHRRDQPELLAEELRRLDPDDVYAESLAWLFSDARIDDDREADTFTLIGVATSFPVQAPAYGTAEGRTADGRLADSVQQNAPEPGLADSAATEAMNASEGETGVESEQEIADL